MGTPGRARALFHRARAVAWVLFGAASFALGLADSVALVWAASVYANAVSDWTASEAATPTTDPAVLERLDRIEALLAERLPAP